MITASTSIVMDPFPIPESLGLDLAGYRLEEVVGHGSLSTVYIGHRDYQQFAVKELVLSRQPGDRHSLILERVERIARLDSMDIAQLKDWHKTDKSLYLISTLAGGPSAEHFFGQPLGWTVALEIAIRIARKLADAWYQLGIPHGNLKPSNLFLEFNGKTLIDLMITDFGIPPIRSLSAGDELMATEAFQSPEVRVGGLVDQCNDFYSLGALVIFLATGKPPSLSVAQTRSALTDVPDHVYGILKSLMHPRPERRPNGWREVLRNLERTRLGYRADLTAQASATFSQVEASGSTPDGDTGEPESLAKPFLPFSREHLLHGQMLQSIGESGIEDPKGFAIGSIIAESYKVLGLLRQDSCVSVYEVEGVILPGRFLLKIISSHGMQFPLIRERIRVERTILSSLNPRFFPPVIGRGIWEGREYFLVKRPYGHPLTAYFQNGSVLDESNALWVAHELAMTLQDGHQTIRLVHRDLNPEHLTIMADQDRHLMITDCSLAYGRVQLDYEDFASRDELPTIGVAPHLAVGTPAYMSPEQIRGEPPSVSMDIYGIGCLLFRMLVGRTPFTANNASLMMHAHLYARPPLLSQYVQVTDVTNELVRDCLAKDPNRRPASHEELAVRLKKCAFALELKGKRLAKDLETKRFQRESTNRFGRR